MMGGEERGQITAVLLPPGRATISWSYSEEILMPSLWKVSRWQFSDGHPTELFGKPVKSLHLILFWLDSFQVLLLLQFSHLQAALLDEIPAKTIKAFVIATWLWQRNSCIPSHTTWWGMNSTPIIPSLFLLPLFTSPLPCSEKCRVCMLSRHPGGEWNVYPADLGQSYTLYKSFSFLCTLLFWDRNEAHSSSVFLINWVVSLAICPSRSILYNFLYKPDDSLLQSPPGLTNKAGVEVRKFLLANCDKMCLLFSQFWSVIGSVWSVVFSSEPHW